MFNVAVLDHNAPIQAGSKLTMDVINAVGVELDSMTEIERETFWGEIHEQLEGLRREKAVKNPARIG